MNTEIIYLVSGMLFSLIFIKGCAILSKRFCKHANLHENKPDVFICTHCKKIVTL